MDENTIVALLLGLCSAIAVVYITANRISFWKKEGARVLEPGYVPPLPTWLTRLVRTIAGRVFVFLFIGKLRIIGKRNLKYCGRLIGGGNHQTERDAILMPYLFGMRQTRFFIAKTQATGWRAPLVAWFGGIVVEHATRRGPIAALLAAIKAMQEEPGTDFIIFPQGKLVRDNVLQRKEWFSGFVVLGEKVGPESQKTVSHLPFAICYDRDPSHATWVHRLFNFVGFKNFRNFFGEVVYGAVVVVGEPVEVSCLPQDKEKATDVLFERVQTLSARAEAAVRS